MRLVICFALKALLDIGVMAVSGILVKDAIDMSENSGPEALYTKLLICGIAAIATALLQFSVIIVLILKISWAKRIFFIQLLFPVLFLAELLVPLVETYPNSYRETNPFYSIVGINTIASIGMIVLLWKEGWSIGQSGKVHNSETHPATQPQANLQYKSQPEHPPATFGQNQNQYPDQHQILQPNYQYQSHDNFPDQQHNFQQQYQHGPPADNLGHIPNRFTYPNQQPNHQQHLNQQPNHQQHLNQQPNHQQHLNQQPNHQQHLNQQPNHQQHLNQQPNHQQHLNHSSLSPPPTMYSDPRYRNQNNTTANKEIVDYGNFQIPRPKSVNSN